MNLFYINYPSWIHPEIFPGIPFLGILRWYGLMYVFAFGTAYFVLKKIFKEGALDSIDRKTTEDDLASFIITGIIFLLIGARVLSTLVYDTSGKYLYLNVLPCIGCSPQVGGGLLLHHHAVGEDLRQCYFCCH